jgi:glyoxylase-like metal-dependent hydrolase (beta-lactamase superfamily II)
MIPPYVEVIRIPFTVPGPAGPIARWVHAFLIDGPKLTLVDAAVAGAEDELLARVGRRGRRPAELATLLLTHAHPDHVGAARPLREATGCRVAVHEAERRWVEDTEAQARERPVPGFDRLVAGPVPVDRGLRDGDVIDLGTVGALRVLHTPGHSPGSVAFLHEADGVLFSGDAVPVPGDLPIYDDPGAVVRSLEALARLEVRLLLSAWDAPCAGAEAHRRIRDAISWMHRIDEAVREAAQGPDAPDPMALCREVVPSLGLPPQAANPLVARSLVSHLKLGRGPATSS